MAGHTNTVRTTIGFLRSFLARRLPFMGEGKELPGIYNYLALAGVYTTSGQPSEAQFGLIREAGFDQVINLAPQSILENALVDEEGILERLGMEYVHIPVDFKNPRDEDFHQFLHAVDGARPGRLWVHCAANMRVSAFTYRYRVEVLSQDKTAALADLHRIWQPVGVWKDFIGD